MILKIGEGNLSMEGVFSFRQNVAELFKRKVMAVYRTETSHLDMATYMDPRIRRENDPIMESIILLDAELVNRTVGEPAQTAPKPPRNALQEIFDEDDDDIEIAPSINNEIKDFISEKKLSHGQCPLMWWKRKQGNYPTLSGIAKKYLCITATSVPSERIFSVSGNILTAERYSLTDEHVEQLTFLTKNKNLIRC